MHLCGGVRVVCMCGSVCVPLVCMCGSVLYMCVKLNGCILIWTYSIPPLQAQLQLAVEQEDKFHQSYQSLMLVWAVWRRPRRLVALALPINPFPLLPGSLEAAR